MNNRKLVWILIFLVLVGGYVGENDYQDQKIIEARKEEIRYKPALSFPIPYTASISVCVANQCRTTYYVSPARERNF